MEIVKTNSNPLKKVYLKNLVQPGEGRLETGYDPCGIFPFWKK